MKMVWAKVMMCVACLQTPISGAVASLSDGKQEVESLVGDESELADVACNAVNGHDSDLGNSPADKEGNKKRKRIRKTVVQRRHEREERLKGLEFQKKDLEAKIEEIRKFNKNMLNKLLVAGRYASLRHELLGSANSGDDSLERASESEQNTITPAVLQSSWSILGTLDVDTLAELLAGGSDTI